MKYRRISLYLILLASLSLLHRVSLADENLHILTAQQWNIPRKAETILSITSLRAAVQEFQATPQSNMQIKYPGGDEGTLWAHELRGWLISLGISSNEIELVPGAASPDQLEIRNIKPKS